MSSQHALTPQQQAMLDTGLATLTLVAPNFGANGVLLSAIVTAAHDALKAASNASADITDEQLLAVFGQFDVNRMDDLQAQADAIAAATGKPPEPT